MKKNKTILLVTVIVILLLFIGMLIFLGNKDKDFNLSGKHNIVTSLNAQNQEEIDSKIREDLDANNYKLSNAKVYLNPYGISPLSALITFKTDEEAEVEVTIKGKNNNDLITKYSSNTKHYIPVYGLYEDYENIIEIKLSNGESKTFAIKTEKISDSLLASISNADYTLLNQTDIYMFTSPLSMNSFGFDVYGDMRWYINEYYYHDIKALDNGHFLIGTDDFNEEGLSTKILEIDYLGRIYNEYKIEEGYLNDIYLKEDGNLILASKIEGRDTYSDYIIEIDSSTGKIVKSWDVRKILEKIDANLMTSSQIDYFYNSGIEYNSDADSLLLTYWGGEFVINLNYSTGDVIWIFSNPNNFSNAFSSYLLKPSNDFVYPKSMHSATLVGNTLKLFDNGFNTNNEVLEYSLMQGAYSSANTYEINNKNISLISSIDENKEYFSYALGDYSILDNSHEIVLFGRDLTDIESSPKSNVNDWENLNSVLIEKKSGNTILEMTFNSASYKVTKVDMSISHDFDFTSPKFYSTLMPSESSKLTDEIISKVTNAIEIKEYNIGYSNEIIEVGRIFLENEEASLILINDSKEGAMYTLKEQGVEGIKKIIPDLDNGTYYVYILENGDVYKTDKFIEIK